jgi:hypothetical protein
MLKYGFPFHSTKGGKIVGLGFGKEYFFFISIAMQINICFFLMQMKFTNKQNLMAYRLDGSY